MKNIELSSKTIINTYPESIQGVLNRALIKCWSEGISMRLKRPSYLSNNERTVYIDVRGGKKNRERVKNIFESVNLNVRFYKMLF